MYKFLKNSLKGTLIRIFENLTTEKNRKSLINILSNNTDGHYFDESLIEDWIKKMNIKNL